MRKIFLAICIILILSNCNNSQNKPIEQNNRLELVHEPDKNLREEYEKQKKLNQTACIFDEPDTSVAGIILRDDESTLDILGETTRLQGDSTHIYYSSDKKQKLGLTVFPGDYYNQVSIFKISYTENVKKNIPQINISEFKTEKGIKLGITKTEIIDKLGKCYVTKDSTKNNISLYYRLELPNDSRTKLLRSNNMPIYYASYVLTNDNLEIIEFGFEYP